MISDAEIPFWRFLLTGSDENRQLKIWCTVKWDCLQTITFEPGPSPSLSTNQDTFENYIFLIYFVRVSVNS